MERYYSSTSGGLCSQEDASDLHPFLCTSSHRVKSLHYSDLQTTCPLRRSATNSGWAEISPSSRLASHLWTVLSRYEPSSTDTNAVECRAQDTWLAAVEKPGLDATTCQT